MRVCFGTLCFSSRLNGPSAADGEAFHRREPPPGPSERSPIAGGCDAVSEMADLVHLQEQLAAKDATIAELRAQLAAIERDDDRLAALRLELELRDRDILNLRSQLDKFQTVFRVHSPASPQRPAGGGKGLALARPRKQRAGISAEPQSEATLLELGRQAFATHPKDIR